MDYLKVLRTMCHCSKSFDKFMHRPTEYALADFLEDETDGDDDFSVVVESQELVVHCWHGKTKACFYIPGEPRVIKIGFKDFKINHAAREYEIYREAVDASVEDFFVPCEKIGEIFQNPIFVMDFVDVDETRITSDVFDHFEAGEACGIVDDDDGFVEALFPFYYNCDIDELMHFLYDHHVNDLHSGNIGYDMNGVIKLVDYSGYFPY